MTELNHGDFIRDLKERKLFPGWKARKDLLEGFESILFQDNSQVIQVDEDLEHVKNNLTWTGLSLDNLNQISENVGVVISGMFPNENKRDEQIRKIKRYVKLIMLYNLEREIDSTILSWGEDNPGKTLSPADRHVSYRFVSTSIETVISMMNLSKSRDTVYSQLYTINFNLLDQNDAEKQLKRLGIHRAGPCISDDGVRLTIKYLGSQFRTDLRVDATDDEIVDLIKNGKMYAFDAKLFLTMEKK